jgi:glycerophosphoryl diester phosphodiesterase
VEIDVQVGPTSDVVVGHDPIDWSAGGAATVGLTELLTVIDEGGITLLIDFKSVGDPEVEAGIMAEALAAATRPDAILVSSFSVPFLRKLRELAPQLVLLPIVSLRQNFPRPRPADGEAWDGFSVLAAALINPSFLRRAAAGQRLFVWFGVTEWPWLVRAVARLPVEGLIASKLGRALDLLAR